MAKKINKKNYPYINFKLIQEVLEGYQEYANRGATTKELLEYGYGRQLLKKLKSQKKIDSTRWHKHGREFLLIWHEPGWVPMGRYKWFLVKFRRKLKRWYKRMEYKITGVGG